VATLFESLLLAEGGTALHRALFQRHDPQAATDSRLQAALLRLRALKAHMGPALSEQPWTAVLARLKRGDAAMMLMGDWAKGELLESGWRLGQDFGCTAAPGTAGLHLFSVDSFTMFAKDYSHATAQERLARLLVSAPLQAEYNAIKGSVSVRRDADPAQMDSCARESWLAFGQATAQLAPSLVHRMATDESSKDAIVAELHRFFVDPGVQASDVQRRLGAMFRVLPRTPALQ
jgi:glucose/mannose transport system substrate-binding protein